MKKPIITISQKCFMGNKQKIGSLLSEFSGAFGSTKEAEKAIELISRACKKEPQKAEECIKHGVNVARELLSLKQRKEIVVAGIAHHTLDLGLAEEEIEKELGKDVLGLIDSKQRFERALIIKSENAEGSRKKLLVVLSANPEVVILELSDTLIMLKEIDKIAPEKRDEFVFEVKEVFAPLAHKAGIYQLSSQLNELSFKYLEPKNYQKTENEIKSTVKETTEDIENTKKTLEHELKKINIRASVKGRIKTIYSTYAKMQKKNAELKDIHDLIALRVITETVKECYEILGIVHSIWKPVPGEFDDYIAKPKDNGYSSLHTTVLSHKENLIEIQIKTQDMHNFSEYGSASHWRYKGERKDSKYDKKIEWVKQILDWQQSTDKKAKMSIFEKEIFALTPKGQVVELPDGATVVDFAYAVHSDVGHHCQNAKINGSIAPLSATIKNGDVVEIITSQKQLPKMSWLSFVKSSKAKQKIRVKLQIQKSKKPTTIRHRGDALKIRANDKKIRLAKCCSPLPGDEIIGLKTTKRKISIHRSDCDQVSNKYSGIIKVSWQGAKEEYKTTLIVKSKDRLGLLKDILEVILDSGVQVDSTNTKTIENNYAICKFRVELKNAEQLDELARKLRKVRGVSGVYSE